MATLKDALQLERSRLFVGRRSEMEYIDAWLGRPHAPTELVFVSGIGGIGKSALLLKFLDRFEQAGALILWLDGRAIPESPSGFLDAMHTALFRTAGYGSDRSLAPATIQDMSEAIGHKRALLCIDNYESLSQIESWLREIFLPEMPDEQLLIVLSGRQPLSVEWQHDRAWSGKLKLMPLDRLSPTDALNYYINFGIGDESRREALIRDTHGYPLAMALSVEKADLLQTVTSSAETWPASRLISARLLREVVTPDLQEAIDVLSILSSARQEQLNRLLRTPLNVRQLDGLTQLSFVRPAPQGIALHDVARAYLLDDFMRREPERFRTIRRAIVLDACRTLRQAAPHEKNGIASMLLIICQDALPRDVFYRNPAAVLFERYRKDDLLRLHKLLEEEPPQQAIPLEKAIDQHRLLDELAERFPESIRVYRSEQGVPLVFHAGLFLYKETCRFLGNYIPAVIEACFPAEIEHLFKLRYEEADTYFHFLGAVEHHDSAHAVRELYDLMFTDGFSCILSMGIRMSLVPTSTLVRGKFESLGFHYRQLVNLPASHPAYGGGVLELDLRKEDFGDWVSSFLDAPLPEPASMAAGNVVTANDVRKALHAVANSTGLEGQPEAVGLGMERTEPHEMLRRLIYADPLPSPLSRRSQELLQLLSAQPELIAEEVAAQLHISRATYYRHLQTALGQAASVLMRNRSNIPNHAAKP